jgi:hypothetical protein
MEGLVNSLEDLDTWKENKEKTDEKNKLLLKELADLKKEKA